MQNIQEELYTKAALEMYPDNFKLIYFGTVELTEGAADLDAVQAAYEVLQAEYDNAQYSRDRAVAYPSIEDQLDKIYHDGIDAWKADIKAVKDEYPKP